MANGWKSATDLLKEVFQEHFGATGESIQKIKLGRGAVGKIAVISIAAMIGISGVGLRLSTTASQIAAIMVLGVVCLVALGCVIYVIIRQPEMAVLEGAELVLYKQVTLGTKEHPELPNHTIPVPEDAISVESEELDDSSGGAG